MHSARDVAYYFLALANEDEGELISNLKIQKLVYFAQGFSMAINGCKLFNDQIEAWQHGPVVPGLYREFKDFGNGAIRIPQDGFDINTFNQDEQELLDEVYQVYGQFSAWRLREITHKEGPWKHYYSENNRGAVIPDQDIKSYFETQLNN